MAKILVVEDDLSNRQLVSLALEDEGHEVLMVGSGDEALEAVFHYRPNLVMTDLTMPGMSGITLCHRLRNDARTAFTPIIFFSGHRSVKDKLACFEAGADDYITKPVDIEELLARVEVQLRKVRERGIVNSLSQLPGGTMVEQVLAMMLRREGLRFAVLYIDLNNFKAYNDYYGFIRGNQVILLLADILQDIVSAGASEIDFIGHIGGDDFVAITCAERAEEVCKAIIKEFDSRVPELYDEVDRQRGFILTKSRQGQNQCYPITSLAIAVVTNQYRRIESILQIGELSAELKRVAKQQIGSSYCLDRRTKLIPRPITRMLNKWIQRA